MTTFKLLFATFTLCLAQFAQAQVIDESTRPRDAEWMSYREAYKGMLWFEKYGKAKNLIQMHLQVSPKDKSSSIEGMRLHLLGSMTHLELPLDATGRTILPLKKSAYDDNAELVLNQRQGQASFRLRMSLVTRQDGVYAISELRAACAQTLAFQNLTEPLLVRGKKCVGVRLAFAKKDASALAEIKPETGNVFSLGLVDNAAIWNDSIANYKVGSLSFDNLGDQAQLLTRTPPLVMVAIIE